VLQLTGSGLQEYLGGVARRRRQVGIAFHLTLDMIHHGYKGWVVHQALSQLGEQHRFQENSKRLALALGIVGLDRTDTFRNQSGQVGCRVRRGARTLPGARGSSLACLLPAQRSHLDANERRKLVCGINAGQREVLKRILFDHGDLEW
jgi:hypothetical protein